MLQKNIASPSSLISFGGVKGGGWKTTTALFLAQQLAAQQKAVLVVDLDFRSPMLGAFKGLNANYAHSVAAALLDNKPIDKKLWLQKDKPNPVYVPGNTALDFDEVEKSPLLLKRLGRTLAKITAERSFSILDLAGGSSYELVRKPMYLSNILVIVFPGIYEQCAENAYKQQIKDVFEYYKQHNALALFPHIILVATHLPALRVGLLSKILAKPAEPASPVASGYKEKFESDFAENDWVKLLPPGRSLITEALDIHFIQEDTAAALARDRIPGELAGPLNKLTGAILNIASGDNSTAPQRLQILQGRQPAGGDG